MFLRVGAGPAARSRFKVKGSRFKASAPAGSPQASASRQTVPFSLPLIGIFIAVTWGVWELAATCRVLKVGLGIVAAVVLAACMVVTRKQIGWWKDSETLFQRMIEAVEGNYVAHYNIGNLYSQQDKLAEAIPHYQKALEIDPKDFQTHFNLGLSLLRQGRLAEARAHFVEALRLWPDYAEAQRALAELDSSTEEQK